MPDETQKAKPVAPPEDDARELRPVTFFNGQSTLVTKDMRPRMTDATAEAPAPTKGSVVTEDERPNIPVPQGKGPAAEGDNEPPAPPKEPRREPPLIPDPDEDPEESEDDGRPKGKKKK